MVDLNQSIIKSLDGTEKELVQFIPYLLQDLWEIGSSPEPIIRLIKDCNLDHKEMKILDLGCGKGFVTISLAREFKCHCHGIDAMPDFIYEAEQKAIEYSVSEFCTFEINDIRTRVVDLTNFDIIILGSIGDVLGDYTDTLNKLSNCINNNGAIIIDDGYDNSSKSELSDNLSREIIMEQISRAGMKLVREIIQSKQYIKESNEIIYSKILKRSYELIKQYPAKQNLFEKYLELQKEENNILENEFTCSTMLIQLNLL